MPKTRLPIRVRRGGPWLALGIAAALVALPGVAHADAGSGLLPGSSSDPVSGAVSGLLPGGSGTGLGGSGSLPGSQNQGNAGTNATDTGAASTTSSGSPSPQQQIQSALEQAGVSAKCADSVQNDLTQLITDIPTSVQAIISTLTAGMSSPTPPSPAEITAALQDLLNGKVPSGSTATDTTSGSAAASTPPVAQDLQKLVTDFVANCIPAPPSGLPSMPGSPSSPSTPQPQTQAASQPTTQPAAQPVSYPGYAATGSIAPTALRPAGDHRSSDPVPLSVLGGVLLVSTATAVGVRARVRRGGR